MPFDHHTSPSVLLTAIIAIAERAGRAIMAVYSRDDVGVSHKTDASPVTEADIAAHHIIVEALAELTPGIPIVSEEAADDPRKRQGTPFIWLVDPLDGTKEFLKKSHEFTVNIALIYQGMAVMGVVHVPATDVTYYGASDTGAHKKSGGTDKPIAVYRGKRKPVVVASVTHLDAATAAFIEKLGPHTLVSAGSSLKFCLIAEGKADIYPRLAPTTNEWDTAAGDAVLRAAGGEVVQSDTSQAMVYNKRSMRNNPFIARSKHCKIKI